VKRWTVTEIWARTPRIALASFLIFFFAILLAKPCRADDAANKAVRDLAQKLSAQIDRDKKLNVEVFDLTGQMHGADFDPVQHLIETEFRAHGFRIVTDTSYEIKIRITLSQDSIERLWVADFTADGKQSTIMVPFELTTPDLSPWATRVQLDRELVYSQNSPMLDFGCDSSPAAKDCGEILILNADNVVFMATERKFPSVAIPHDKPWPRNVRGRLRRNGAAFDVNIGGVYCSGNTDAAGTMRCLPTGNQQLFFDGPMSERTRAVAASEQNWFEWTGAVGPNDAPLKRSPFYSIGGFEVNGQTAWVASGMDGKVRVFADRSKDPIGSISGWGSDLATVKSDCGTGWQILATEPRDYTESDSITVYEWAGTEFRALSDSIEMNGPIVAMWSAQDGAPARAVVRNLKTGNYEAYLLKVGCSQ